GSRLQAIGAIDPQLSVPIQVEGDGALLRLSNGAPVIVSRRNVPGENGVAGTAYGVLRVGAGASISGDAAITLDSAADTLVDSSASLAAATIDVNSGRISFVADDAIAADGLVIGPNTLEQLSAAREVNLRSRGSIDFIGDLDIRSAGRLSLSAGSFRGDGGIVSIEAATLRLADDLGAAATTATAGGGELRLRGGEIRFGGGGSAFSGFARFDALASNAMLMEGSGSFDLGSSAVLLHTPVLAALAGAANGLVTRGSLTADAAGAGTASIPGQLGGALSLSGATLDIDTRIDVPAGSVTLNASAGNLSLGAQALVGVQGETKTFFDTTKFAPGGMIRLLAANGRVSMAEGAVLDFSADAAGGDAGSLQIVAADTELRGSLRGAAGSSGSGGSLELQTGAAINLDALAAALAAGGIDRSIGVRAGQGNLLLSETTTLRAREVSLTADGGAAPSAAAGNVIVHGVIDASGRKGGDISLHGRSGVAIDGTLRASGSAADERGGNIRLGTSGVSDGGTDAQLGYQRVQAAGSGRIDIGAGALIDVSGGSAGGLSGGTLQLRAPLLANGEIGVRIDPAATIRGSRDTTIEAYAVWSTRDGSSGARHFDGIIDPSGRFNAAGSDHAGFYVDTLQRFVNGAAFAF
ncbi:MAG TPA: filamentous hemagglutinin, partial [Burkholderiaceae bacterium]|nr:filamentous hemagglutinin [Burkholderiaceae bacterium]